MASRPGNAAIAPLTSRDACKARRSRYADGSCSVIFLSSKAERAASTRMTSSMQATSSRACSRSEGRDVLLAIDRANCSHCSAISGFSTRGIASPCWVGLRLSPSSTLPGCAMAFLLASCLRVIFVTRCSGCFRIFRRFDQGRQRCLLLYASTRIMLNLSEASRKFLPIKNHFTHDDVATCLRRLNHAVNTLKLTQPKAESLGRNGVLVDVLRSQKRNQVVPCLSRPLKQSLCQGNQSWLDRIGAGPVANPFQDGVDGLVSTQIYNSGSDSIVPHKFPALDRVEPHRERFDVVPRNCRSGSKRGRLDRKSTRLNSSHT